MKVLNKIFITILISTLLSACGFQLRGSFESNFDSIYISGGTKDFTKILKKRVKQAGIKIKSSSEAERSVEIISDTFTKNILSIGGDGKVREYEIKYQVSYRFKSQDGAWSKPIDLEVMREYAYDDDDLLAKGAEEATLVKGMKDQIIRTMVSQISLIK
jgi:LPS-assembly lipoprotein|tara:strand:- start:556 stop:1032 length:477 start_codon:yes stop_codon:yes gene_type:complete